MLLGCAALNFYFFINQLAEFFFFNILRHIPLLDFSLRKVTREIAAIDSYAIKITVIKYTANIKRKTIDIEYHIGLSQYLQYWRQAFPACYHRMRCLHDERFLQSHGLWTFAAIQSYAFNAHVHTHFRVPYILSGRARVSLTIIVEINSVVTYGSSSSSSSFTSS